MTAISTITFHNLTDHDDNTKTEVALIHFTNGKYISYVLGRDEDDSVSFTPGEELLTDALAALANSRP